MNSLFDIGLYNLVLTKYSIVVLINKLNGIFKEMYMSLEVCNFRVTICHFTICRKISITLRVRITNNHKT